jgi:flagellar motor switch/type III secretory pathway protein FliN
MSDNAAGPIQPWLLLGERRRRSLENRVRTAAERWAAQWITGTVTPSVAIGSAARSPTPEYGDRGTLHFGARQQGEWLAELVVPRHLVAWAAGLAAVEFSAAADPDEISFAGEIELAMLQAFWDLLIPQAVKGEASLECLDEAQAQEVHRALAKRGIRALCSLGAAAAGVSIQVTLSPAMFATLLAERPVSYVGESLLSRRSAVAQAPVPLECCLGSVQVPVRDLHSLRIGDVLVTDITLDGRAELRVRNKPRPIAAGTLGTVEGRKALKVETAQVVMANRGLRR